MMRWNPRLPDYQVGRSEDLRLHAPAPAPMIPVTNPMTTPHSSQDFVPNVIPIGVVAEEFQGMGRKTGNQRNRWTATSQKTRLIARWNKTETIELQSAVTIPANAEPLTPAA